MSHPFITCGRTDWSRGSWIDHILHSGEPDYINVLGAYNALGAELDDISDHKPLWGFFQVAPAAGLTIVRMARPRPRPDLKVSDRRILHEYRATLSEVLYQLPAPGAGLAAAESDMELATRYTVQLVTDLSRRRPPSHFKDGYSPEFMLRKWHLCAVLNIRRHLTGQHGKTRWISLARIQNNIRYVYQVLRSRASGLGLSTTRVQDILRGGDESYWIDLGASLSVAHCTNLIINLKRALHGRKRQEMRLASSG